MRGKKFTQYEWAEPCFCDKNSKCQCKYILCSGYGGSIATISVDNGKLIVEGGNDSPSLDEARANAKLIVAAPEMFSLLEECELNENSTALKQKITKLLDRICE